MARANSTAEPGLERNVFKSIPATIAGAIADSNHQFTFCYRTPKIVRMTETPKDSRVEKLRALVDKAGGPANFARKHSKNDADKPIDATYLSQILTGHRAFGDKARANMAKRAGLPENYFELSYIESSTAMELGTDQAHAAYDLTPFPTQKSDREHALEQLSELSIHLDMLRLGMLIKTARDLLAEMPAKQTQGLSG